MLTLAGGLVPSSGVRDITPYAANEQHRSDPSIGIPTGPPQQNTCHSAGFPGIYQIDLICRDEESAEARLDRRLYHPLEF
jgi:hypothetical protein